MIAINTRDSTRVHHAPAMIFQQLEVAAPSDQGDPVAWCNVVRHTQPFNPNKSGGVPH